MNLAAMALQKRVVTYFAVFLVVLAGIGSFFRLGQLEDPEFTVKTAVVVTSYPGAGPEEVELEVTDRIELAIQEMKQLDYLDSESRAGLSVIKVNIKSEYWADRLPQVWDELRRKVRDVQTSLPPGAGEPSVVDDYGDVFGFLLAVTGDGFSYAELEGYVDELKRELSLVDGVARVDLWGIQDRIVYIDAAESQLSQIGLSDSSLEATLREQNMVVDAGSLDLQNRRFRISPTGEFGSPQDIENLVIRPSLADSLQNPTTGEGAGRTADLIRIGDIGTVREGYRDPPANLLRFNGEPAIGIALTNIPGGNIVDIGRAIDAKLAELLPHLPIGIEINRVHWQSDVVAEAINGFLINFAEAVLIVLAVLTVTMGWRMGLVIGSSLIVTILGSFILMALFGIDLQRMSLGALVIALGMMVDNSIVVADGFVVRIQQGMDRKKAAIEAANLPSWPLLGATVVAVMAFYPIFASIEDAGEYCRTLFVVVAISLLTSWVVSMTLTPIQCLDMLPSPKPGEGSKDPYGSFFYRGFGSLLRRAIQARWLTLGGMAALLVVAVVGFGNVKQLFFPDSSMTKFMVDIWSPEGTRIQNLAADLKMAEEKLLGDDRVAEVAAFIGQGPPRFYLPVEPESQNPAYAQLIVNVQDYRAIDGLIADLDPWFRENYPYALIPQRKYGVGPSDTWKFELRIIGPAVADPGRLRGLAGDVETILAGSPLVAAYTTDWRQRVSKVVPHFNDERGRWANITREDVAKTTKRAFDGRVVGMYRENDDLIPIVLRHVEAERQNVGNLDLLQVQPSMATATVPLSQVTDAVDVEWEDPVIPRRDRRRTITVQANPVSGVTLPTLRAALIDQLEAVQLPPGYRMEWGGETESSADAQKSLVPGVVPALAVIIFIIVALFNAFRPPLIIMLTIPFAVIGISAGLLGTGTPFGFMALLGAMSLAGMMIKNAVVLLDQVDIEIAGGKGRYEAVMEAALSRLRPVVLAAATTVLGVIPLLQDVFWIGMAVTIMAGLTFGTILTMVLVPVLYATLFRVRAANPVGEAS